MDRLSCHRFLANQFRLLLHGLAYQMFVRLRDYLYGTPRPRRIGRNSKSKLCVAGSSKLGMIAGSTNHSTHLGAHLSSGFPEQALFLLVLNRLNSSSSSLS